MSPLAAQASVTLQAVLKSRFGFLSDDEACLLARQWAAALTEYEVEGWLQAGLGPRDHQLAEALRANGVRTEHLALEINDVHLARLLRDGRSVEAVAGRCGEQAECESRLATTRP